MYVDYMCGRFTLRTPAQQWAYAVELPRSEEAQHEGPVVVDVAVRVVNGAIGVGCLDHEGRLLVWRTEACFRDAAGRWWFVSLLDYFHNHHPSGDREYISRKKTAK